MPAKKQSDKLAAAEKRISDLSAKIEELEEQLRLCMATPARSRSTSPTKTRKAATTADPRAAGHTSEPLNPPAPYDGKIPGEIFVHRFRQYAESKNLSAERKLQEFDMLLHDPKSTVNFHALLKSEPSLPFDDLVRRWLQSLSPPPLDRQQAQMALKALKQEQRESFRDLAARTQELVKAAHPRSGDLDRITVDCFTGAVRDATLAAKLVNWVADRAALDMEEPTLAATVAACERFSSLPPITTAAPQPQQDSRIDQLAATVEALVRRLDAPPKQKQHYQPPHIRQQHYVHQTTSNVATKNE